MPKNNLVAMKEKLQSAFPPQKRSNQRGDEPGPAKPVPQIGRKLMDGRGIVFWGEPDMEAVFIRKGTKVTLSDSGAPLPDGAFQLDDGSEMLVQQGAVLRFERRYFSVRELVIAALLGLAFVFLLFLLAN